MMCPIFQSKPTSSKFLKVRPVQEHSFEQPEEIESLIFFPAIVVFTFIRGAMPRINAAGYLLVYNISISIRFFLVIKSYPHEVMRYLTFVKITLFGFNVFNVGPAYFIIFFSKICEGYLSLVKNWNWTG